MVQKMNYRRLIKWIIPFSLILSSIGAFIMTNFAPEKIAASYQIAAYTVAILVSIFSLLTLLLNIRDREINESEKRLEKFYIPTKKFLESITNGGYKIEQNYKDKIEELSKYKYLATEKTEEQFTQFETIFLSKKPLSENEKKVINLLLKTVEEDIKFYEKKIKEQLKMV